MTDNQLELPNIQVGAPTSQPSVIITRMVVLPLKVITIKRIASLQEGTFGVLFDERIPFALTLERPWKDNRKGESCIPLGEYTCKRVMSPKFGDTFEVTAVHGRDHILFHRGNLWDDSHGCILVGEQYEPIARPDGTLCNGIAASGKGYQEFHERLRGHEQCKLIIQAA